MQDQKALAILKKYYLPYRTADKPSEGDLKAGVQAGVIAACSEITHGEMVSEIKRLSKRLPLENAAKGFLYSLSTCLGEIAAGTYFRQNRT